MTRHVLVPVDGSPQSEAALEHALEEFPDADVTVLTVVDPLTIPFDAGVDGAVTTEGWFESAEESATEILSAAETTAAEYDVEIETVTEFGDPTRTITDYAEEHDVDHVVMGSHGRTGVSRVLLGSVAENVVRRAHCPVTVVR